MKTVDFLPGESSLSTRARLVPGGHLWESRTSSNQLSRARLARQLMTPILLLLTILTLSMTPRALEG